MKDLLEGKLSICAVILGCADLPFLKDFADAAAELSHDVEIVLVTNAALDSSEAREMISVVNELNDTTMLFLDTPRDRDVAYLACLDNAIGDWILLVDVRQIDLRIWREMLSSAADGNDVVVELSNVGRLPSIYGLSRRVFLQLYRALTGLSVLAPPPRSRLYSRLAAVYLLNRREGDMLLKCASIGSAFPAATVSSARPERRMPSRGIRDAISKAWRVVHQSSAFPARTAAAIALTAALLNVVYAGYAVASYLTRSDIAPGWATQSLQISGLFFLVFLLLAIISENLSAISRAVGHRLRYTVVREVRSRRSRFANQLNVVSESNERTASEAGG
jgi:hypothetical protein